MSEKTFQELEAERVAAEEARVLKERDAEAKRDGIVERLRGNRP